MQCRYCNANLPDGAAFCAVCGKKQEPVSEAGCFCARCGAQLSSGAVFCGNCGARNEKAAAAPVIPEKKPVLRNITLPKLQMSKKWMTAGLGAVAAVLVILLVVSLFSGSSDTGIVYLKDGQLQHILASGKTEAYTLTDRLSAKKNLASGDFLELGINEKVKMSADGKKLFYPQKMDGNNYTLYVQDLSNTKKDPVKVDSGLTDDYEINDKGSLVTYLKDGKLYQHDLKEKTKIGSDITDFCVSADGKYLLYTKAEKEEWAPAAEAEEEPDAAAEKKRGYDGVTLYLKIGKEDPVKLDENIYRYEFNGDLSVIYYLIEYDLYMVRDGKEPSKVASDVEDIWSVGKSGCYYTVLNEERIVFWDLIEDDLQNQESEHMRGVLEEQTMTNPFADMYFHNGKESVLADKQVCGYIASSSEEDFLGYYAVAGDELPTFKLSEYLDYDGSFEDFFVETIDENTRPCILQGAEAAELPLEDIYKVVVGEKAQTLWVMTDFDKKTSEVTLHQVKASGGSIKSVEEIDDEVYYNAFLTDGKNYAYWKSVKNFVGELYFNGEEIADDVSISNCNIDADSGRVSFKMDYSNKTYEYTLAYWDGKKVIEVDEDVSSHMALGEKCIAYLKDYSSSKGEGDLFVWTGKKSAKLDEDVMYILPVYRKK